MPDKFQKNIKSVSQKKIFVAMLKKTVKLFLPTRLQFKLNNIRNSRKYDVKFGESARADDTIFEGLNYINSYSTIRDSYVGVGSYISGGCNLSKVKIGRFSSIGQNVCNRFSLHPTSGFVSTHPAFFSPKMQAGFTFADKSYFKENKYIDEGSKFLTSIGNDVWIGSKVLIMNGVVISDGAIVAAGSVVTKNIGPYQIVGGVPAKLIRHRFSEDIIEKLLEIEWWNLDIEILGKCFKDFHDINTFVDKYFKQV